LGGVRARDAFHFQAVLAARVRTLIYDRAAFGIRELFISRRKEEAMAVRRTPWIRTFTLACFAASVLLLGCNRKQAQPEAKEDSGEQVEEKAEATAPKAAVDPRYRQTFAEATRADPPPDSRPEPATATGKSTGKLYTEVKRSWDTIALVGDDGKPLAYRAVLETKLGVIEIDLKPEIAPNHVRNFIALARAGYYDGLLFEGVVHQVAPDKPEIKTDLVVAGNPTGMDDAGLASYGSIGYWLKPEFTDQPLHEEGAVGAFHGEEADTAACRFYIMLSKAPSLDGTSTVFGKVSKGLDLVRTIATQPFKIDEQEEGYGRPVQPVVIDKVTVQVVK
jgi:peptidyl-prolyl cis-trans isomerase B (cyclophilin B)